MRREYEGGRRGEEARTIEIRNEFSFQRHRKAEMVIQIARGLREAVRKKTKEVQ